MNIYGEEGELWLRTLPMIITDLSEKYELQNLEQEKNLSFHFGV
jgi:hypothetical protein